MLMNLRIRVLRYVTPLSSRCATSPRKGQSQGPGPPGQAMDRLVKFTLPFLGEFGDFLLGAAQVKPTYGQLWTQCEQGTVPKSGSQWASG